MLTDRSAFSSAIRQNLPIDCLNEIGQKFEVNGLFQLIDSDGVPYACDKSAAWGSPLYCLLMSMEMNTASGLIKRRHFGNSYNGAWVANDFNTFTAIFTVTQELSESTSAFFYFQGPASDSSIIFNHITIVPLDETS